MNSTYCLIQLGSRAASLLLLSAACFSLALASSALGASGGKTRTLPDFTRGDVIPADAKHDWNLGPTGARGWMFCDQMVTSDARQVRITAVDKGSPAEGILAVGDVLLGVGGKAFSFDPRTELGSAITAAETEAGGGKLALTRWRAGQTEEVVVTLPVLGTFSATAPYDCPKSSLILKRGLAALSQRMSAPDYGRGMDAIPRTLNALALLAGGVSNHLALVKREAQWAAHFKTDGFRTWYYGYVMMFLAEYVTATGDQSVLPALRRFALDAANGQSAVGSWGHTFARTDGRLSGYGMMNSPGLPLTIGLVLARDAGLKDAELTRAIELSARLLRFYIGKGSVPYGDHAPWMEGHEDNGKCGMAAVLFNRLSEANGAEFFTRMATAAHGNERDQGHTGNFFNLLWSLLAIAQAGPQATGAWMKEFGTAYHDLARRWDGSWAHQGAPEPDFDSYQGWDCTGAYLLGYAMPLKAITLTGKRPGIVRPFTAETAQNIIADGRGWTNKDRTGYYLALGETELLKRLGSWSPIVRERAAAALAKLKERPVQAVVGLLDAPQLETRLGACSALEAFGGQAAPAVPKLRATLEHPDLWLRVRAGEALAAIGKAALPALPEMLERVNAGPVEGDPRGMEQRYFSFAVFGRLLKRHRTLEGVDRDKLRAAMTRGLQNQDGRARSEISEIYPLLSFEDLRPLLPAIQEAIVKPAPSGEMFADQVRVNGLKLLAQHHVEEGIEGCVDYLLAQNPWASELRTPDVLETLLKYGARARRIIPRLQDIATSFDKGEPDFPLSLSQRKAAAIRDAIARIETSQIRPELKRVTP